MPEEPATATSRDQVLLSSAASYVLLAIVVGSVVMIVSYDYYPAVVLGWFLLACVVGAVTGAFVDLTIFEDSGPEGAGGPSSRKQVTFSWVSTTTGTALVLASVIKSFFSEATIVLVFSMLAGPMTAYACVVINRRLRHLPRRATEQ